MTKDSITPPENLREATSDPPREEAQQAPQPEEEEKKETLSRTKVIMAFAATLLTLVAWALAIWSNGYASLAVALLGVVCGIIGASRRAGQWRNLAITCIIASGVLAVVMSAFLIVITVGLS